VRNRISKSEFHAKLCIAQWLRFNGGVKEKNLTHFNPWRGCPYFSVDLQHCRAR